MGKAKEFLNIFEANMDPEVMKVVDQLDDAFQKAGMNSSLRTGATGNLSGKLYKIVTDKNWNNGDPIAMFRIPVIITERGKDTTKETYDATNSLQNFNKVFNPVWGLRDKGWIISQPRGGNQEGDGWENKDQQTMGNILQFVIGKPAAKE
jgi:hypothetical protein